MSYQRRLWAAHTFGVLARFANWFQARPHKATPAAFRLLQLGSAFWQSRALYVAARLDLATLLAEQTLATPELAQMAGAQAPALQRLMRMLVAMGVFEEVGKGRYRNNALSDALRQDSPHSVRAMVLMHNSTEMSLPWFEHLEQGIRTGQSPFSLHHGAGLYDYMDAHPEFDALFAQAMDQVEALTGDSFATNFNWQAFTRVIDVGGSQGAKSMAILKRHPHLQALVVDRAQTIQNAAAFWYARDSGEAVSRMRFEVGDVLTAVPAANGPRDAYLLSAVLHGFDDDTCVQALQNVAQAAGAKGAKQATIVLLELVLPEHHADLTQATFDMQMFMGTPGRERTLTEWHNVFDRAGVSLTEIVHLASFGKMLVLRAVQKH